MSLRYLLLNQLKSLAQAGYTVVGISATGANIAVIQAAGIRHIPIAMQRRFTPLADMVALWQLYWVMRRERFTIVHTHTPKPGLLGQLAARLAGVPIVINTLHGFYFQDQTPWFWRKFYIFTEWVAAKCSDTILSQNREDMDTAVREKICRAEKIKYLGNGINLDYFDPQRLDTHKIETIRQQWNIPMNAPIIGFVGRLVREKGLVDLFQAMAIVLTHLPHARLLVVGPVDSEKGDAVTPDMAHTYGIADACIFTGLQTEMPELYALMDVFVLPSHREGFPRAPMEATAMRVPCIVTDIRGCRETVVPKQNGLLVPLGNIVALAKAIVQLLTQPEERKRMGAAGRYLAQERFDEQKVFAIVKDEYARLLNQKALPAPCSEPPN